MMLRFIGSIEDGLPDANVFSMFTDVNDLGKSTS